ncbi:hypothetical protein MF271_23740 (plasmid) [Deinococcus sp. KNUC1210]|uniref:hypothetical protein n=1 Tax=Deinococcus sp. KNUC1210 TaxID=2917691 RepID=UPI001EF0061D|nr:hypothetical protein [Deinococcus sp. KNUC1210]ULH17977.1 hypothetical protein MF271_23740 [Deinococcus sp. KNUC1210]
MTERLRFLLVGLLLFGTPSALATFGHEEHTIEPKAFSFALKYRSAGATYANDILKQTTIGCDEAGAAPTHRCIFAIITLRQKAGEQETYISLHDGKSGMFECGIFLPSQQARLKYVLQVTPESWTLYQQSGNTMIDLTVKLKCLEN